MLRIFFTSDDVARTRIAPAPDPLWELMMSMHMLRAQPGDLLFRHWRKSATAALGRADLGERLRLLLALCPPAGYFPDFLNPYAAIRGLEHGLDAVRSTPKAALGHDLRQLATRQHLPHRAKRLAAGEPQLLAEITDTMQICYDLAVSPSRRTVDAAVERDRRVRHDALISGGVEQLLTSLRPIIRWNSGELCLPTHPRDQELHLNGRGLTLIPSYFCVHGPVTMFDPQLPPVVVYPVDKQADTLPVGRRTPGSLRALIGATRAAVLDAIATRFCTTTDLGRRVGISAASASEHAAVLRQAGLVTSFRDRNRMLHTPTPLGLALLDAGPVPVETNLPISPRQQQVRPSVLDLAKSPTRNRSPRPPARASDGSG